jgi:hypothetical protein
MKNLRGIDDLGSPCEYQLWQMNLDLDMDMILGLKFRGEW